MIQEFQSSLQFELDQFQLAACRALTANQSVLVAAPTGSGKTVVAEFALFLTMKQTRRKVFYTTPIKALSNQKYHEFCETYGEDKVGLLTGDISVNPNARIVVMTTEVLRNMLYADSELLPDLNFVIMDEVHYLADRFRGAVWEEVIIHLPRTVRLISLSATVSNAEEFGDWLQSVRGDTTVIVSEERPVPLHQHVMIRGELVNLFFGRNNSNDSRVNPELLRIARAVSTPAPMPSARKGLRRSAIQRWRSPRTDRAETIRVLDQNDLVPVIYFIFSRVGCDEAVLGLVRAGISLTTKDERSQIRELVELRCKELPGEDLQVLGYHEWLNGLQHGIAAHHAGLIPTFKELVEELFVKRLLKVVFATETLALGVNMPARTVVLEKLEKFNGEARVPISAGEFTQLTGRAGRRGIDSEGHSVIQWQQGLEPIALASLASRRTYPLNSSFRPGYNMAVNLIAQFGAKKSREILESSFAQFQADRAVVGIAQKVRAQEESLKGYENSSKCHLGDFKEYAQLRRELSGLEKLPAKGEKSSLRSSRLEKIATLRRKLKAHPCHSCPERESHSRWSERWFALNRQTENLRQQIQNRTGAISRTFERICNVLLDLDYLEREGGDLKVTRVGESLRRVYSERDLLISECLRSRAWDGLTPDALAGIVSALVYEPKRDQESVSFAGYPSGGFKRAFENTIELWEKLQIIQDRFGLDSEPSPVANLSLAMSEWSKGESLERVLSLVDLAPGDFVRTTKQVIDLLDQLSKTVIPSLAENATIALNSVNRGLVAWSRFS